MMNILGIMTGTSLDGIDLALVHYDGAKYHMKDFAMISFPDDLRKGLISLVEEQSFTLDFILKIQSSYNKFIVNQVVAFNQNKNIDLIGFSGQTIRHLPKESITWQIGSPGILAGATGIKTVGDFRTQDMGAQGQGAPLIAFVDFLLSDSNPIIFLNIGGIANITFINKPENIVIAFDTGPGNMIIDSLMRILYNKNFDENGTISSKGKVDQEILRELLLYPFFTVHPPKSTGRVDFGSHYVQKFLKATEHLTKEDKIATATALTTQSIIHSIETYVPCDSGQIIVSGGGKENKTIVNNLQHKLSNWKFKELKEMNIDENAKEAYAFAILAHHAVMGKVNQLPQATGAIRPLVLGGIYHG